MLVARNRKTTVQCICKNLNPNLFQQKIIVADENEHRKNDIDEKPCSGYCAEGLNRSEYVLHTCVCVCIETHGPARWYCLTDGDFPSE